MDKDIEREFEGRITAVEESVKQAHKRVDENAKLTESVFTLATEVKLMREDMSDIKNRVDDIEQQSTTTEVKLIHEDLSKIELRVNNIEQQPSKKWDLLITTIMTAVASGLVGYIVSIFFR